MNNPAVLVLAALGGGLLGVIFFGGLWWTVLRGLTSPAPALWFFGSLLLRTGIVVTGFIFVSAGHWERILACLLGFFAARLLVARLTAPRRTDLGEEKSHAP